MNRIPSKRSTPPDATEDRRAFLQLTRSVGGRVRAARAARRQTLAAFATTCGLSRRFLTDVEHGNANVSLLGLTKIATALGMSVAALVAETDTVATASQSAHRFALVGLRGAGKSTLGRAVAERCGVTFVELDQLVEAAAGMPLADLFTLHGESYYRQLERQALERLVDEHSSLVVATGGGIVAAPETYELLRRRFVTIWLKSQPADHWNRVVEQGDQRPMRGQPEAMARLRAILAERAPLYGLADHVIDTSALGIEPSLARLEALVREKQ